MGSGKLAAKVLLALGFDSPVVEMSDFFEGRRMADESLAELQQAAEGHSPLMQLFLITWGMTEKLTQQLLELPELEAHRRAISAAEDCFIPRCPPGSPVSKAFFDQWSCIDLVRGHDRESLTDIAIEVFVRSGCFPELLDLLRNLRSSRLGIYEVREVDPMAPEMVELSEALSGLSIWAEIGSGYRARVSEVLLIRLLAPPSDDPDLPWLACSTPYVYRETEPATIEAWLERQRRPGESTTASLEHCFKRPDDELVWLEYVTLAHAGFSHQAISITGVPDRPSTLPRDQGADA